MTSIRLLVLITLLSASFLLHGGFWNLFPHSVGGGFIDLSSAGFGALRSRKLARAAHSIGTHVEVSDHEAVKADVTEAKDDARFEDQALNNTFADDFDFISFNISWVDASKLLPTVWNIYRLHPTYSTGSAEHARVFSWRPEKLSPPRVIFPDLKQLSLRDMQERKEYWTSLMFWMLIKTCLLAEVINFVAWLIWRGMHIREQCNPYQPLRISDTEQNKEEECQETFCPVNELLEHRYKVRRFFCWLDGSCIFCVLVAVFNQNLDATSGLAWEVYVILEILWIGFQLTVLIHKCFDENFQLNAPVSAHILAFAIPAQSIIIDTLKDWIFIGFCIAASGATFLGIVGTSVIAFLAYLYPIWTSLFASYIVAAYLLLTFSPWVSCSASSHPMWAELVCQTIGRSAALGSVMTVVGIFSIFRTHFLIAKDEWLVDLFHEEYFTFPISKQQPFIQPGFKVTLTNHSEEQEVDSISCHRKHLRFNLSSPGTSSEALEVNGPGFLKSNSILLKHVEEVKWDLAYVRSTFKLAALKQVLHLTSPPRECIWWWQDLPFAVLHFIYFLCFNQNLFFRLSACVTLLKLLNGCLRRPTLCRLSSEDPAILLQLSQCHMCDNILKDPNNTNLLLFHADAHVVQRTLRLQMIQDTTKFKSTEHIARLDHLHGNHECLMVRLSALVLRVAADPTSDYGKELKLTLEDKAHRFRWKIIEYLGLCRPMNKRILKIIVSHLRDVDPRMKAEAAKALGAFNVELDPCRLGTQGRDVFSRPPEMHRDARPHRELFEILDGAVVDLLKCYAEASKKRFTDKVTKYQCWELLFDESENDYHCYCAYQALLSQHMAKYCTDKLHEIYALNADPVLKDAADFILKELRNPPLKVTSHENPTYTIHEGRLL